MKRLKLMSKKMRFVLPLCLFLACFFFGNEVNAQSYPDLVDNATAQTMLVDELPALRNNLDGLQPGSTDYDFAERKFNLYQHTWEVLTGGEATDDALSSAYTEFAVDATGNDANLDELAEVDDFSSKGSGDQAFDELVNLLEEK